MVPRTCLSARGPPELELVSKSVLGRARLYSLRKNSMLHLILGGAALQRCEKAFVSVPALAAEVNDSTFSATSLAVPPPATKNAGFSPEGRFFLNLKSFLETSSR